MISPEVNPWFALHIAPRMEMHATSALRAKGYECLLPTYIMRKQWSDRKKTAEVPLFPGYIFCRLSDESHGLAVTTIGVRRIVSFDGKPYPIAEEEIQSLRTAIESQAKILPHPFGCVGKKVKILDGPLAGATGILTRIENQQRLIISIEILMRSVSVSVDSCSIVQAAA